MEKSLKLKDFLSTLLGSAQSGKINRDRKCLFCGTKLSDDGLKKIRVRMGRLRYLIRSIDEGSETAEKLFHNIIYTGEYIGGRDIPENYPDWWIEAVGKINEETTPYERALRVVKEIEYFEGDVSILITLLIMKNLIEINREFVETVDKSEILISLTIGYMAAKAIFDSKQWRDQIPHSMVKEFKNVLLEARSLLDQFGSRVRATRKL